MQASALLDRDLPPFAVSMTKADGVARRRQNAGARLGPLDERDRVLEVRLEVAPLGRGYPLEPVEVEMRHLAAGAVVAMPDRVGRARHALAHAERRTGAAHERRLAAAELARHRNDVAGGEPYCELRRQGLGLLGRP